MVDDSVRSQRRNEPEVNMLFALAVLLLIIAIVGGIAVHPLLFLIALLAIFAFVGGRRGAAI